MATVPTNNISNRYKETGLNSQVDHVCGQCGCLIATEHVARHTAWHAQAAWTQATVTTDGSGAW